MRDPPTTKCPNVSITFPAYPWTSTSRVALTLSARRKRVRTRRTAGKEAKSSGRLTNIAVSNSSTSGGCQILDLTLGPLNLNVLGLVVTLNQVHLNITAQPGPGNLLGNLLCSVSHLLDNGNTSGRANLLNLLNGLL